jgi:hypothetical protein
MTAARNSIMCVSVQVCRRVSVYECTKMVRSAECGVQPFTIFLPMPLALDSEGQGAQDKGHGI